MIILNEIMDTMSKGKRAIILDRIRFRQNARSLVDVSGKYKQLNRHASEVGKRALKSNKKKYGIKASDLPDDYCDHMISTMFKDTDHVNNQYNKLLDKKFTLNRQNKSNQDSSSNNTTNDSSWFGRNKGKVALGIGVGTAAAYGIHKYRQNKKKKEEEARRQAEAESQNKKSSGFKRFLNR